MNAIDPQLQALHRDALYRLGGLVELLAPASLERATPCTGWTVRDLVEHAVGLNMGFAEAIASGNAARDAYDSRPVRWWEHSVDAVVQAAAESHADQVTIVPISPDVPFSRTDALRMHLLDIVVHSWDLAVSIGTDFVPSDEAVSAISNLAGLIALRPLPSTYEQFAPAIERPGEGRWRQALRQLGRDPAWEPVAICGGHEDGPSTTGV